MMNPVSNNAVSGSLYPPAADAMSVAAMPGVSGTPGGAVRPFAQFLRHAAPTPTPGRLEFYWDEFHANFKKSQDKGNARFKQELKNNKRSTFKLIVFSLLAGLGFTAFRRLRRTFTYLFMMALMGYPIMEALKTFPKLGEAYKQVQAGNPTKGRETFRKALDDSVYSIYQGFFKPIGYGVQIALLLSIPGALLRKDGGFVQNLIRKAFELLRIPPDILPVRMLDRIAKPLIDWGNQVSNGIRRKVRFIDYLERG